MDMECQIIVGAVFIYNLFKINLPSQIQLIKSNLVNYNCGSINFQSKRELFKNTQPFIDGKCKRMMHKIQ